MGQEGKYLYCIIRSKEPREFPLQGIGPGRPTVYTVHYLDLAAVVSDSLVTRYDISRENTLTHVRVIEMVMGHGFTVLPVRFGTIAQRGEDVQEKLLKRRFGLLHGLLQEMDDKVELGVNAFWNKERVFQEIIEEEEQIRVMRDALAGRPAEATHYARIQLGTLVEQALWRKRDRDAEEVLVGLRPLAAEVRVNKVLTETMVLNAAFLVPRESEAAFDERMSQLREKSRGRMTFKYVGPSPPFNFVDIVVHWDEE